MERATPGRTSQVNNRVGLLSLGHTFLVEVPYTRTPISILVKLASGFPEAAAQKGKPGNFSQVPKASTWLKQPVPIKLKWLYGFSSGSFDPHR